MRSACAARACAFGNSVYNRRSSAANFTLMMGMVMFQYSTSGLNVPPLANALAAYGAQR